MSEEIDKIVPERFEAHKNISRDNFFIKVMKIVLPAIFILSFGAFLFAAGMFDDLFEEEKEARAKPADSAVMKQPKITRYDKKSQSYELTADQAVQDKGRPELVSLEKVKIVVNLTNSNQKVDITADNGLYDSKNEELALSQNILVNSDNGYKANLSQALVKLSEGTITSLKPVTVFMPGGKVESNAMEITENGNNIHFQNRATMTLDKVQ